MVEFRNQTPVHTVLSFRSTELCIHCRLEVLVPVMLNLVEEVTRFFLAMFLILFTLYVSLINPNSFIVIELSGNMNLISVEIHSLQVFRF